MVERTITVPSSKVCSPLTFDSQGNLWITTDIHGGSEKEPEYERRKSSVRW